VKETSETNCGRSSEASVLNGGAAREWKDSRAPYAKTLSGRPSKRDAATISRPPDRERHDAAPTFIDEHERQREQVEQCGLLQVHAVQSLPSASWICPPGRNGGAGEATHPYTTGIVIVATRSSLPRLVVSEASNWLTC